MLKIRLTRRGKKNSAFFRLVVAEHTSPIKGKFLEALGFLNPHTKEKSLKEDRIKYWMEKGAQCSDSAHNLLVSSGIISGPKRAIKMKKKEVEEPKKEEVKPEDGKKEEPAPAKEEALAEKKEEKKEEKTEEKKVEEHKAEVVKEEVKEEKKEEPASSEGEEKKSA